MQDDRTPDAGQQAPRTSLRTIRAWLWAFVALALAGAAVLLIGRGGPASPPTVQSHAQPGFGGPFTLSDGEGKSFSSSRLAGKPYALFFGFTRCGDVCPTTLGRLVKLRDQAGDRSALNILFITIDPANDGPKEVGQYAELFNSPIVGLTGSAEQIAAVKKQYGIHAEPNPHSSGHGDAITHTGSVLLFDARGAVAGTIAADDTDAEALEKIRRLLV